MAASESAKLRRGHFDVAPWSGTAWRAHRAKYSAEDPGGSFKVSGRFNRGLDRFPQDEVFPALYLGLDRAGTLGEILRHLPAGLSLEVLNAFRLSRLYIELSRALD